MEKFITLKQAYLRPIQQSNVLQFIISFSKSKCEKHPFQYMKLDVIVSTYLCVSKLRQRVYKMTKMDNLAQRLILKI